jgi:hypothetical protein
MMVAAAFVGLVVHVSAANQCPASALGACARLHLEFMRSHMAPPMELVATPMRATTDRG